MALTLKELHLVTSRVANRIADGKFKLDGREYQLAQVIILILILIIIIIMKNMAIVIIKTMLQNNGPNALHGGLVGLDKVL